MKKLAVVLVLVLAAGGYMLYQQHESQEAPIIKPPSLINTGVENITPTTGTAGASATQQPSTKVLKDGTYSGDTTDAFYGLMQVQLVVTGGKISDIKFLQYPDKPGHTTEVSTVALPMLRQEAIQKQSAPVDVISGATQTSDAFNQSLASALVKAQ